MKRTFKANKNVPLCFPKSLGQGLAPQNATQRTSKIIQCCKSSPRGARTQANPEGHQQSDGASFIQAAAEPIRNRPSE